MHCQLPFDVRHLVGMGVSCDRSDLVGVKYGWYWCQLWLIMDSWLMWAGCVRRRGSSIVQRYDNGRLGRPGRAWGTRAGPTNTCGQNKHYKFAFYVFIAHWLVAMKQGAWRMATPLFDHTALHQLLSPPITHIRPTILAWSCLHWQNYLQWRRSPISMKHTTESSDFIIKSLAIHTLHTAVPFLFVWGQELSSLCCSIQLITRTCPSACVLIAVCESKHRRTWAFDMLAMFASLWRLSNYSNALTSCFHYLLQLTEYRDSVKRTFTAPYKRVCVLVCYRSFILTQLSSLAYSNFLTFLAFQSAQSKGQQKRGQE